MKLNRTGSNWTRTERNKINENWDILEGSYNDVAGEITDEVFKEIVDSARLDWKLPVDSFGDLPSEAGVGDTRMVRDTGKVYRFDGNSWNEIQDIDPTAINEVDNRLSKQLADNMRQTTVLLSEKADKSVSVTKEELQQGLEPKADQSFVDAQFASIVSGAPKATYANLQALKDAYPNGEEGVFLVLSDGNWYYWNEEERDWLSGGLYQSVSWEDFMTENGQRWEI